MSVHLNLRAIRGAVWMLEQCSEKGRLIELKNLCINNGGIWTLPQPPYPPRATYEVSVLGIAAMAEDPELLPPNWLRAARAILTAADTEQATTLGRSDPSLAPQSEIYQRADTLSKS